MDFEAQLEDLVNEFNKGLEVGFSLQYLVQNNIALITSLLRSHQKTGALSLKALSHQLGVNAYSLKTAISRVKAANEKIDVTKPCSQLSQKLQIVSLGEIEISEKSDDLSFNNSLRVLHANQKISQEEMALLNAKEPFIYSTQSDLFLMSFKFKSKNLMVFDAIPRKGKSSLKRTIKFDIERKLFC